MLKCVPVVIYDNPYAVFTHAGGSRAGSIASGSVLNDALLMKPHGCSIKKDHP